MLMKKLLNIQRVLLFMLLACFAGGLSPAWADAKALPYEYGFEDYNLATDGWTKYFGTSLTSNNNECAIVGVAKKTGSYGFRFSSNNASGENAQYLISPELNAPNGVIVTFAYKASSGTYSESFKVGYSTTDADVSSFTWDEGKTTNNTSFQTYETTFPAGTKYVAIYYYSNYQSRLYVDDFSFTVPLSGPALAVVDGSTTINSGYNYNFGLTTAGTTHYFLLSNSGTEDLGVSVSETGDFGAILSTTTIPADNSAYVALTVTMPATTGNSVITITPESGSGIDPFVINVSGTIRDENKVYLDFADGQMPDGWSWVAIGSYASSYPCSVNEGFISWSQYGGSSYAWAFTSPLLSFAKDELIAFETTRYGSSSYYNPSVIVQYSLDGTTWKSIGDAFNDDVYGTWTKRSVTIPVEGVKYIRFNGWYIQMRNIYGGEKPEGAMFAITPETASFGVVAQNAVAEQTFTISNTGTSPLAITATDATDFYVAKTVMFTKPNSWTGDKLYIYAWDGSGSLTGDWPGIEVTKAAQNDMSEWVYTATLPKGATGIKFSDNASHETGNISTSDFKQVIGLWLDGSEVKTWKNEELTVAANGTAELPVRMATATVGAKSGNIELAFDALNATSFTIPVSGYVIDPDKYTVNFDNNTLPDFWTNGSNSGASWTFADGVAYGQYANYKNAKMMSPLLTVADGESLVFQTKGNNSYSDMKVNVYQRDGSTKVKTVDFSTDARAAYTAGEYTTVILSGLSAGDYKLEFEAYNSYIDNINGFTLNLNDPKAAIYANADGTGEQITAQTVTDLGWDNTGTASKTYYIKNEGSGTLNITSLTAPEGIIVATANDATTVAQGATLAMTITMTDAIGSRNGNISLETDGGDYLLNVKGFVYGDKNLVDFTNASQYAGWTTEGWTIDEGVASVSSSKTMQTTKFSVDANEKLYVEAKSNGSYYNSASLTYSYSTDNGATWTAEAAIIDNTSSSSDYVVHTLSDIADAEVARTVLLRFTGANVAINRIYGFTAVATAVMETTATNIAFGTQKAESAEQSFTITNTGTADLTGLSVTLGKTGDDAEYSIRMTDSEDAEFTGSTLAAGATITVHVKQLFDVNKLGSKSDVLTIAATDQTPIAINLTGATSDPSILFVDFDNSSEWPAEILEPRDGWSVYNYNGAGEARQGSSSTATSLTLTPLTVASTEDKLTFDVAYYSSSSSRELTVSYTTDGGLNWTDYNWGTAEEPVYDLKQSISSSYATQTITGIPAGTVVFKFTGKCIKIDNISGDMKVAQAPLMTFTTVEDNISGANLKADGTATYTLANNGNADYVATVATTNVMAEVTGDDVTFASNTLTIPAGKTANITVTMAFAAPYGEKTGNLSITSTSWVGDITADYTANLVDPTSFVEDFAAGKPAGWYNGGWTISGGDAHVYTGTAKELITEKLGVESGKDELSFDAKVYTGSDEQTLNVYTSTDRKTWSAAQTFTLTDAVQSFKLAALAADSYVKFEASNASIDNLTGVKKLEAPAHDLFEVSNTMAATGIPGASYTATVVGVSLRADETVTAELWLKKEGNYIEVAKLIDQAMTVDVNKTFTLTGDLPNEEGEYKMWVTVKNSDNSAYFNTDEIDFTLTHTHTMAITKYENAANVQADDNNEYAATFFVTVENTGSAPIASDKVSITLNDGENDYDFTWTNATSNVLYMNTKKDETDIATDCTLKAWCWNTTEDGVWSAFTKINDGFWSVDLNGKTNFKICRVNPDGTDENPWNNVWNKSADLSLTDGNLVKFTGYDDTAINFSAESMTMLEPTMTTTLKLTIDGTLTDGYDALLTFTAKENVSNTYYGSGLTRSVNVTAAPVIDLNELYVTIESTGQNRRVSLNRTFVAGWNTICLPFALDVTDIHANAKALEFSAYNDATKELTFSPVTELEANKPYVIYVPEEITGAYYFAFSGKTVSTVDDPETAIEGVTFQGTYAPMAAGSLSGMWGLTAGGKIVKADGNTTMSGFRAYFSGVPANARVVFLGDESTGIAGVERMGNAENEKFYNLNGQRIAQPTKGLYIVNGQKVAIK